MADKPAKGGRPAKPRPELKPGPDGIIRLSGGNPQIAKGDGDGPVQAYVAAMEGWKSNLGREIDTLVTATIPEISKAVRWNSPFFGMPGQGWFLSLHCFTKFVRVTWIKGQALTPIPPGPSKDPDARYLDIYEGDTLDQAQFTAWLDQSRHIPGWIP